MKPAPAIAGLIGFVVLGVALGLLYPAAREWLVVAPTDAVVLVPDLACDPTRKACVATGEGLTITLTLVGTVRVLTPFVVNVDLAGRDATRITDVSVEFAMTGMDMGINNRFGLNPAGEDRWQGQALLPICTTNRRDWRVWVEIAGPTPYRGEFALMVGL